MTFAVQRKHRNEQMALDPLAQLVQIEPEFGLERPECRFQFSQAPVGANRILSAPLRVAGAQDIMARSGMRASYAALRFQVTALALPSGAFVTVMS